jgi:hypothetical protein
MASAAAGSATRLVTILRALPQGELNALATRLGASIDPNKRVDGPVQIARVLVNQNAVRDPSRLPAPSVQLLRRLTESGGTLVVSAVPPALEPLAARGMVFARANGRGQIELVLPTALLLLMPPWEGEDPRGIRTLFAQASNETLASIASHYLGKPATPPIAIALEPAWETLSVRDRVRAELQSLAALEHRLLETIEREGGEVDTEELLDLEREPLRIRGAMGATPTRRGVGFALERRGMLMPVHPNRHVIPTEVAEVIGAARASKREGKRAQVRAFVLDREHEPRRARFALDPAPLALALALVAREPGSEVREGAGSPRSLIQRLAQRFGREPDAVALIVALSRAMGLWDPSALSRAVPPGSHKLSDLALALFGTWRRGGAWDEARPEPEMLRLPLDSRDPSPVGGLRDIVIDALSELGEGRWVPWEALADYVRTDARTPGLTRLMRRWAERALIDPPMAADVARRIVFDSLPTLGLVDIGESEQDEESDDNLGPLVRITPRGRAILQARLPEVEPVPSVFVDQNTLRLGSTVTLGSALALHPFVEIGKVANSIELSITSATLSRAVSIGLDSELIRNSFESIVPLPESLSRTLEQMSVIVGRVNYAPASGFVWCDDPNVREMLRTRRHTADLFVDPSPPGGLLVAEGKDLDWVARRCRTLGVELAFDGRLVCARSTTPPGRSDRPSVRRPVRAASSHTEALAGRRKIPSRG